MGKNSSSSSSSSSVWSRGGWRYLHPSLYLKRPKRLAFLIFLNYFLWDRRTLSSSHQPQTKNGIDSFGGLGATLVNSFDTLFIMGLKEQFHRARDWAASALDFNKDYEASVFETTISSLFYASIEPYHVFLLFQGNSILADSGTEQLEFIAFSQRIKDPKYQQKVENVIKEVHKIFPSDGLLPIYINPQSGTTSQSTITFGAMGDSFYEYLLKAWIQGNETEAVKHYRLPGLAIISISQPPQNWLERTISFVLERFDAFPPAIVLVIVVLISLLDIMTVGTSWNILRPETVESLFYL
ncbi:hypothetical protein CRYUN_Cryun03dG0099900 [Craigia yunnanensis]